MKQRIANFGLLLIAAALGEAAMSAEYGCPIGAPAQHVAADYNHRWSTAVESGDPEKLGELYTHNAVLMPPTDETIIGRSLIGKYLAAADKNPQLENYSVDIVACELAGDTLKFAGVWGAEQIDYRGRQIAMTGNLVRILDRQPDGSWALSYEIWN